MLQSIAPETETALGELSAESEDPFRILIGTILSHRTRDTNTTKACNQLFAIYDTPEKLAAADPSQLEPLIKPVGFYRVKSRRIKEVAELIVNRFGGKVPDTLEELLSLPAVGRKTANCVLVYGFNKPAIPVDTHVHRIMNRLGFVSTKTPEETEGALTKNVDKKYWLEINDLLVRFGQEICRPVNPRCKDCLLKEACPYGKDRLRAEIRG
ncbi:MAG: endonuclease III [Thaumarchaeota archaeon]|nr:endonuclease III [Nitrososphaerota archaeon]